MRKLKKAIKMFENRFMNNFYKNNFKIDSISWLFSAPFLETCYFKDPDFFKCSTRSVQGLFNELVKGNKLVEFKVFKLKYFSQNITWCQY